MTRSAIWRGDATLETVADRLTTALPADSVIGRLAGDEFAVIVDKLEAGTESLPALEKLARTLLDRLADPFYVQGHEVFYDGQHGHRILSNGCTKCY